ncbi:hypothetical protein BKA70DRAFT_360477 [Coprinopsis sp. MPI-PUGE-AT-0042]|nr:hypothetical protein BKA70DRAFT_360477 [Coprinopsis sp. MPI-PUGE-AT-0042]
MTSGLPSELVREIVGHFSRANDMGALQAASLASSAFREPCQEEIFSSVHIYKQRSAKNHTAHHLTGLKILLLNKALLSYIRIVSVTHSPDGSYTFDKEPMESVTTELIQLIATPVIQKFSFIGWEGGTTPGFQHGIVALVRSPRLISLSLTHAPAQLVGMVESPHLRHLMLQLGTTIYQSRSDVQLFLEPFQPTATQRHRPTSLAVAANRSTISLLLGNSSSFELDAVKELALESTWNSRGDVSLLIQHCAPSLRRLRIALRVISADLSNSLGQLQQLEELICDEDLWQGHGNPYGVLPPFLDAFPSPNSIANVELKFFYEDALFPDRVPELWARLDSTLANRCRFAELHTVRFKHIVVEPLKTTPEEWEVKQRGNWPALREAGVVIKMSRVPRIFHIPTDTWD